MVTKRSQAFTRAVIGATQRDDLMLATSLLLNGSDPADRGQENDVEFLALWAVETGITSVVRYSLRKCVDPRSHPVRNLLITAARNGPIETVQLLLNYGYDINARDVSGTTALYAACCAGNISISELLLDHGADIDAQTSGGWAPLGTAALWDNLDIVQLLLDRGAKVNLDDKCNPLMHALNWRKLPSPISMNDLPGYDVAPGPEEDPTVKIEIAKLLLDRGASPQSAELDTGATILHCAARWKLAPIVKQLLDRGAEIEARCHSGDTVMHWAALRRQNEDVFEVLLAAGANIDWPNSSGVTALLRSIDYLQDIPNVNFLLENGASTRHHDESGNTPLSRAQHWRKSGHEELFQLVEHWDNKQN